MSHDHDHDNELDPFAARVRALETILTGKGLIDPAVVRLLPRNKAESFCAIVLFKVRGVLTVAMAEVLFARARLRKRAGFVRQSGERHGLPCRPWAGAQHRIGRRPRDVRVLQRRQCRMVQHEIGAGALVAHISGEDQKLGRRSDDGFDRQRAKTRWLESRRGIGQPAGYHRLLRDAAASRHIAVGFVNKCAHRWTRACAPGSSNGARPGRW